MWLVKKLVKTDVNVDKSKLWYYYKHTTQNEKEENVTQYIVNTADRSKERMK